MKTFPLRALKTTLDIQRNNLEDELRKLQRESALTVEEITAQQKVLQAAQTEMSRAMAAVGGPHGMQMLECAEQWMVFTTGKVQVLQKTLEEQEREILLSVQRLQKLRGQLDVVERKRQHWHSDLAAASLKLSEREFDEIFSMRAGS